MDGSWGVCSLYYNQEISFKRNMTEKPYIAQKPPQLVGIELRVLGALMEKQLTTPDQYPLTVNGIMTACNQKSSREPISNYTTGDIIRTLKELQGTGFVNHEYGSRSEKFSQHFIKHLELGKKHQALLCVMMLRGSQTISELDTRTQRMVEFTDKEDLEHTLDRLCNREVAYVTRLSQQPGQRGERFTHLFSGVPSQSTPDSRDVPISAVSAVPAGNDERASASVAAKSSVEQSGKSAEMEELRFQVSALTEESRLLKQQIARLYQLTGHALDAVEDE